MFEHDGAQTITTAKNLWSVCPAACWENLFELAAGLLGGEEDHLISLVLWAELFPSVALTHIHTPLLCLKALHYLRQSSSTSNHTALSVRQKQKQ